MKAPRTSFPVRPLLLVPVFAFFLLSHARAQFTFANDNADNYGGVGEPGWTNGSDAGLGWGAWNFQNTTADGGIAGQLLASSTAQGFGNINNTTQSFAMYGNPAGANTGKVGRTLDFSLEDGDVFSIDMAVAFRNGDKGIDLFSGATKLWNFSVGNNQYQANGTDLGWSYSQTSVFNLRVAQNSATSITVNLTRGSDSFSTNLAVSGRLNGVDLYVTGTEAGNDLNNFFFNTLLVTNSGLYNVASTQTESRHLTGGGSLAKTGNGTLTISGTTNNFTGTVGITNGAIRAAASSALGAAGAVTVQSGAALEYSGGITVNRNVTINGTGISTAGALRNVGGDNTNSGALTLGSASRIASDAGTLTISGAVSGSNVGLTVGGAGNTAIQTALAIGSGRLTKENAGTLTLTANNSFTGNTLISGGALRLGAGGTTGAVTGTITNNGTLIYNRSDDITQSGIISGTGAVTKQGEGRLTLSSANTYSGATTVSAGAVLADNSASLGTTAGATTVESGATLEVSGGINLTENITITGGGVGGGGAVRSLGDGENTLSGTITLAGNSRINVDAPIGVPTALASWGTDNLIVDTGSTSLSGYTQTATTMTISGSVVLGDTLGALLSLPVSDWSGVSSFGLLFSVAGANNNLPFSLALLDGDFNVANTYTATTSGVSNTPSVVLLSLAQPGTGILSNVSGLQFTWDGGGAINTTLASIMAIPTSGLSISGNINAGNNVLTFGTAEGGAGTVAEGITVTGVISGAGGSYGGTTTSLVKDGAGTLTLRSNNTFTGDIRVERGALAVAAGASTNALGVGADLFLSSLGKLAVNATVSVSSIQGAGAGDSGGIEFANNSALTVNGAGKTMTMAGNITGTGRIRVVGNSATQLTLTGDNSFDNGPSVASADIVAGTLVLAGTGGNQALRSARGVAVAGSGKLLLQTSNQVRDNAVISLSGGTIQRGSGVSEVFGNLNVSSASFIDFGTGAPGTLSFGTYAPSALLTVQNFDFGSTLVFKSNLSTSITNTSLFSFVNGGISSYSWNSGTSTFTITAIPEPSTYAAALGLLGLMLWSQRRSLRRWMG